MGQGRNDFNSASGIAGMVLGRNNPVTGIIRQVEIQQRREEQQRQREERRAEIAERRAEIAERRAERQAEVAAQRAERQAEIAQRRNPGVNPQTLTQAPPAGPPGPFQPVAASTPPAQAPATAQQPAPAPLSPEDREVALEKARNAIDAIGARDRATAEELSQALRTGQPIGAGTAQRANLALDVMTFRFPEAAARARTDLSNGLAVATGQQLPPSSAAFRTEMARQPGPEQAGQRQAFDNWLADQMGTSRLATKNTDGSVTFNGNVRVYADVAYRAVASKLGSDPAAFLNDPKNGELKELVVRYAGGQTPLSPQDFTRRAQELADRAEPRQPQVSAATAAPPPAGQRLAVLDGINMTPEKQQYFQATLAAQVAQDLGDSRMAEAARQTSRAILAANPGLEQEIQNDVRRVMMNQWNRPPGAVAANGGWDPVRDGSLGSAAQVGVNDPATSLRGQAFGPTLRADATMTVRGPAVEPVTPSGPTTPPPRQQDDFRPA